MKKLLCLILLSFVFTWGACTTLNFGSRDRCYSNCSIGTYSTINCSGGSKVISTQTCGSIKYTFTYTCNGSSGSATATLNSTCDGNAIEYSGTFTTCTTQSEVDSLNCANGGGSWSGSSCNFCDPEKWSCNTGSSRVQNQHETSEITCIGNSCFGGVYCEYSSEYTTSCVNDCGDSTSQSMKTEPIYIEGHCDDNDISDDCSPTYCVTNNGSYVAYQLCNTNNVNNGKLQQLPNIISSGSGTCENAGYRERKPESDSSGTSDKNCAGSFCAEDSTQLQNCLLFGICPDNPKDTTDFSDPDNRTPENGCTCEKGAYNTIFCPDGSVSYNFGDCFPSPRSSSSSPESSPGTSGAVPGSSPSEVVGDWATHSQGREIIAELSNLNNIYAQIQVITGAVGSPGSEYVSNTAWRSVPGFSDSSYDVVYSSASGSLALDSIFQQLPKKNDILDTLTLSGSGSCPICTVPYPSFLKMGAGSSWSINLGSFYGVNICSVLAALLYAIVSLFCIALIFNVGRGI